jgi:RNA polymerase sigma factor (TIGR02999 family)
MSETLNITLMLREWSDGNREVLEDLMPLVYDDLHRQAARFLSRERIDHTLQTTDLIHETYLKLVDQREVEWESRTHFFAIAANLMRRILVDYARAKHRKKRGGANALELPLEEAALVIGGKVNSIDLVALDEALMRLEKIDKRQPRLVELRYFGDLTLEETAEALRVFPEQPSPTLGRWQRLGCDAS